MKPRFWENRQLAELGRDEWEALCDGCAKCCLVKLEDEETGEVFYTDIRCRFLDEGTCRCKVYDTRQEHVPACVALGPDRIDQLWMMPTSCAYRRLAEGKPLPDWHHLESGSRDLVLSLEKSVRARSVSEDDIDEDEQEDRLVDWPVLEKE